MMVDDLVTLGKLLGLKIGELGLASELVKLDYTAIIVAVYKDLLKWNTLHHKLIKVRLRRHLLKGKIKPGFDIS